MNSPAIVRGVQVILLVILLTTLNRVNAQITASVTSGCAPLTGVVFNHGYSGATGISWNFGDGASSNLGNPSHTYANPGSYTVTFNATHNGGPVTQQLTIQVFSTPTAAFNIVQPPGGCTGVQVSFQDQSTGSGGVAITTWNWAFGDGGVNTINTATPSYTYNLPGIYDVGLIVTDANGCLSSVTQDDAVVISTPPSVTITTNPTSPTACVAPLNVTFSASVTSNSPLNNNVTYNWNFGNGQTSTATNPPAQTYTTEGVYTASLVVTDANGCSRTTTRTVSISQPIASFEAVGAVNDTVCTNVSFNSSASLGTPLLYNYGDGTTGISSGHTYANPGWYDVTLTVQSGQCQDDTTISIYVEVPMVSISFPHDTICEFPFPYQLSATGSAGATYQWTLPNGMVSTDPVVNDTLWYDELEYSINNARNGTISVQLTTAAGCTVSDSYSFVAVKPNALFFPNKDEGCAPLSITFTDYSTTDVPVISQYIWHFGDGTPDHVATTDGDVTHVYQNPGIYHPYLVVVTHGGCRDTSWIHTISAGVAPTPSFTLSPETVCPGDIIQINDTTSPADSVDTWNFKGDHNLIFSCQDEPNPEVYFKEQTGTATITMTAGNKGCYATTTQTVSVSGPTGHLQYTCNCETPLTYPFVAVTSDADHWTWDFGDGTIQENSAAANVSHTYAAPGDYLAKLTVHNATSGCPPMEDSLLIKVRDLQVTFMMPDSLCAGEAVTFSSLGSTGAASQEGSCYNSFTWYFGDQTQPKITDSEYEHAYINPGVYTVELWGKDVNGCMDSASHVVRIFGIESDFSFTTDGVCLPLTADFIANGSSELPITHYNWTFGDGNTSTTINPTHIYNVSVPPGGNLAPFPVTLTVKNSLGCTHSSSQQITTDIPNALFSNLTATTICEGKSVTLKPNITQTGNQFSWNFGDGETSTTYQPVHVFEEAGSYTITLSVTNASGCTNSNVVSNYVQAQAYPIAGFSSSIVDGETICYPAQITFTDTSIVSPFGSRTWNLGNGVPAIGNSTIGANYNTPGTYNISLIERTTAGCADTAYLSINVEGPVGTFNLSPSTICRGGSIQINMADTVDVATWNWDFGDGTNEAETFSFTHNYDFDFNPESGQTIVSLVMWNNDSICNAVVTREVNFTLARADFWRNNEVAPADTVHCYGTSDQFINMSSSNINEWHWDFDNGTTFNGANPPSVLFNPGEYDVQLAVKTNPLGCVDTLVKKMIIHALPDVTVNSGTICLGDNFQFEATGGEQYQWTPSESLSDDNISAPLAFPDITTTYVVLVTDSNGCEKSASSTIQVFQPIVPVYEEHTIIIGESQDLNADHGSGYSYLWTPEDAINCLDCPSVTVNPLVDTTYYVQISDNLGCFNDTSTYKIIVLPWTSVDVPDVFTPNGDGINDIAFVKGWGIEKLHYFKIYNRWGELVFESNDIDQGWNGYYKEVLQMADTYSYSVSVKHYLKNDPFIKSGFINIVR
jgi:gliding motility-associated-like protein